jgi:hypothetical protein
MSICTDYRRALLSQPDEVASQLCDHRDVCAECTAFSRSAADFEGRLARALKLDLDKAAARRTHGLGRTRVRVVGRRGWLAIAASVTVAIGAVTGVWLAAPVPSVAAAVVAHMAGEPQAWRTTDEPVAPAGLAAVLDEAHVHLSATAGVVSYASSCEFRGHRVPHLVVQTDQGPVTVMVLVHEGVSRVVKFDQEGYRGIVLPVAGHGSIAVLTHGKPDLAEVERIAARVLRAIDWS